ncbi:MAG: hypothetical protein C0613_06380 [Desulfobulbaceae bacterium]|nr:MAG: hypothetical protein C0613_06380 [Desulfobulbaceae bacterium]
MVNRAALILYYKEPFMKWIADADPSGESPPISLGEVNRDKTVYLIDDSDAENLEAWLKRNYADLFETELASWYIDELLWPPKRDLKLFHKWFDAQCHSLLYDLGSGQIYDDYL